MIGVEVVGLEEFQEYLEVMGARLASKDFWEIALGGAMEKARRYAASISPVVTGSYRGAHRVTVGRMCATLSIDPTARNTASGGLVRRYAGPVEKRHRVYARTASQLLGLAERAGEGLLEELVK